MQIIRSRRKIIDKWLFGNLSFDTSYVVLSIQLIFGKFYNICGVHLVVVKCDFPAHVKCEHPLANKHPNEDVKLLFGILFLFYFSSWCRVIVLKIKKLVYLMIGIFQRLEVLCHLRCLSNSSYPVNFQYTLWWKLTVCSEGSWTVPIAIMKINSLHCSPWSFKCQWD